VLNFDFAETIEAGLVLRTQHAKGVKETQGHLGTELNECMHCDELHCSAYYLQACGANRRTAGVVSDINRPLEHVCEAARADALKRVVLHPDLQEKPHAQEL